MSDPPASPYWFDEAAASLAERFFEELLVLYQGEHAGEPFRLMPWQRQILRDVWGTKREDGRRRYRTVYVEVGKGNGKSPFAAGLALLSLFTSGEPGSEIYSCAGDRYQAGITYRDGVAMRTEGLADISTEYRMAGGRLVLEGTRSFWQVLSNEAKTKHGFRPSVVIFDELHTQTNRDLFDAMRLGLMKRREPLLIVITHAGEWDEESLAVQEHEYARRTLLPKEDPLHIDDPSYYAVIYAAGPEDNWLDPETWKKANPAYGITVIPDVLGEIFHRAEHNPAEQARVKQLHLCIWPSPVIENPIPADDWKKCGELESLVCVGDECWLGLDLSSKLDLTALTLLFPHGDGSFSVLTYFWIPEGNLENRKRVEAFDYPRHVETGHITTTFGNWIDQGTIRRKINELGKVYRIREIGYDPMNASQMATWLQDEDGFRVIEVRQGALSLSEPCKRLVGLVRDHKLRHGANPVLSWNAANTTFRADVNQNWAPRKGRQYVRRIDGISALINALSRYLAQPIDKKPWVSVAGG